MNLALISLHLGSYHAAKIAFEKCKQVIIDEERNWLLGGVHMALAASAAGLRDWARFDHHARKVDGLSKLTGFAERDSAWVAERAGELAANVQEYKRSIWALDFALAQYKLLEDEESLQRIEATIRLVTSNLPK